MEKKMVSKEKMNWVFGLLFASAVVVTSACHEEIEVPDSSPNPPSWDLPSDQVVDEDRLACETSCGHLVTMDTVVAECGQSVMGRIEDLCLAACDTEDLQTRTGETSENAQRVDTLFDAVPEAATLCFCGKNIEMCGDWPTGETADEMIDACGEFYRAAEPGRPGETSGPTQSCYHHHHTLAVQDETQRDDLHCPSSRGEEGSACAVGCAEGESCDDFNLCTTADLCVDGTCAGTVVACDDSDPCTEDSCDPADGCQYTEIPECGVCGNGVVEEAEICDGNCPSSCDDGNACTADSESGSAVSCDLTCTNEPLNLGCVDGDGCCAQGCGESDDDCTWDERQKITASDRAGCQGFGRAVAISGNTAIVGTGLDYCEPRVASDRAAYIFEYEAGNWIEKQKLPVPGTGMGHIVVDISGDTAVVGFQSDHPQSVGGSVYIYQRDPSGPWYRIQTLEHTLLTAVAGHPIADNSFGSSVAIDGDTLAVGATTVWCDGEIGAVFLFERKQSGLWAEGQALCPTIPLAGGIRREASGFGFSVSLAASTLAVGANGGTTYNVPLVALAYAFEKDANGVWTQREMFEADPDVFHSASLNRFGSSVATNGDTILVGSKSEEHVKNDKLSLGSVYVFSRDSDGTWTKTVKFLPDWGNTTQFNELGASVSISGDFAVAGAAWENEVGYWREPTGAAYVYERNAAGAWGAPTRLIPSDGERVDRFGDAVAVDGDHMLVGAFWEEDEVSQDSLPSPVNSGAVYFFER
jgi:hypothetical protein